MGTLGQKLDYLTDTKSILKQKINNLGGSLTDENTFRSYGDYLDELYDEMPKVTAEGTEITLTPTRKGKMNIGLKGNTSQDSYEGKNLLPGEAIEHCTITNTGEKTIGQSRVCSDFIEVNPSNNYYLSYGVNYGFSGIAYYNSEYNYISRDAWQNQTDHIITLPVNTQYVKVFGERDTHVDANLNEFANNKAQFTQSSTATDYEPYVGGQPSPNPDYPQPIHVVTGNNSIGVQGKNLFDGNWQGGYVTNDGSIYSTYKRGMTFQNKVEIIGGQTYNISFDISDVSFANTLYVGYYDNNNAFIQRSALSLNYFTEKHYSNNISVPNNAKYMLFSIYTGVDNTIAPTDVTSLQFELGSTDTSYIPYYHADYPINLGSIELCKIGDYQDYLYKENGNWYKYGNIDKIILNGSESIIPEGTKTITQVFNIQNILKSHESLRDVGYCNYFINQPGDTEKFSYVSASTTAKNLYIAINKTRASNAEEFKSWLSNHNIIFYYPTTSPLTTQITDETLISQLDAIENAMSTTGTTIITQTNSDLPFIINASALKPFTTETLLTSLTSGE